jgi:hypothetical protein
MVAAGAFFLAVGAFFLYLEQGLGGPVYSVNCLPGMYCQGIEYNTSPVMPPFLVVFGLVVIGVGLYYRSRHSTPASIRAQTG